MYSHYPHIITMPTLTLKISQSLQDALKRNGEATSRDMSTITREAISQYLRRSPVSSESIADAVLNPHMIRVCELERQVAEQATAIAEMRDRLLMLECSRPR
jgi:predicted DNA-binding protein